MGARKKHWAAEKRDGVGEGVRSNACTPAAWKLVFLPPKREEKPDIPIAGRFAKQVAERQRLAAEPLEHPGLISDPFYIFPSIT